MGNFSQWTQVELPGEAEGCVEVVAELSSVCAEVCIPEGVTVGLSVADGDCVPKEVEYTV